MSLRVMTQGGGSSGPYASIFVTGLSESDTVTATKGGVTKVGKWTARPNPNYIGLPDGYTQLEYIESTGTQYINTNYIPTANSCAELVANVPSSGNQYSTLFGVRAGVNNGSFLVFAPYNYTSDMRVGFGAEEVVVGSIADLYGKKITITLKLNYASAVYDESSKVEKTFTSGTPISTQPIYLFTLNEAGNDFGDVCHAKMKAYSYGVKEGDVAGLMLIPSRRESDGEIGMYDLVTGDFHGNAGTGEFIAGPEVPSTVDCHIIEKIKEYGMWTVTATDGTNTATQNVLIDAAVEYEVALSYTDWLYHEGDECEAKTGGWDCPPIRSGYNWDSQNAYTDAPTRTKNDDNLYVKIVHRAGAYGISAASFWAKNAIDLTDISTLYFEINLLVGHCRFMVSDKDPLTTQFDCNKTSPKYPVHSTAGENVITVDVSDLSGSYYIGFGTELYADYAYTAEVKLKNAWLE